MTRRCENASAPRRRNWFIKISRGTKTRSVWWRWRGNFAHENPAARLRAPDFSETLGDLHRGGVGGTATAWSRTAHPLAVAGARGSAARDHPPRGPGRTHDLRGGRISVGRARISTANTARAFRHGCDGAGAGI